MAFLDGHSSHSTAGRQQGSRLSELVCTMKSSPARPCAMAWFTSVSAYLRLCRCSPSTRAHSGTPPTANACQSLGAPAPTSNSYVPARLPRSGRVTPHAPPMLSWSSSRTAAEGRFY